MRGERGIVSAMTWISHSLTLALLFAALLQLGSAALIRWDEQVAGCVLSLLYIDHQRLLLPPIKHQRIRLRTNCLPNVHWAFQSNK